MPSARAAVVVVNPTKIEDLDAVREELARVARELGEEAPVLVETDADDPGFGQTRRALADGARLVCALGGDGTVRAVAQELAGTGVPLGLLPGGTGNLLARNLGAPVDDLAEAARVALRGGDRTIDIGWLEAAGGRHAFTVMAGLGFDALVMADAPEKVKGVLGWAAYVVSGSRHLSDDPFEATVRLDGEEVHRGPARTVLAGNCGTLTGGVTLLPEALVDDGLLDVGVLTPETLAQWAALAARVVAGRSSDGPSIARRTGRVLEVETATAQRVEADGDVVGEDDRLRLTLEPGGLVVRVPAAG